MQHLRLLLPEVRRRGLLLAATLGLAAVASGCEPETEHASDAGVDAAVACSTPFVGDEALEPELLVTVRGVDGVPFEIAEGDSVPLIQPPQGGRVIFVGARASNLDPCAVKLTGSLRDPATQQVRIDSRTVNLRPSEDGYAESVPANLSTFANVPVCHNQWSESDLFEQVFELALTVTDAAGRVAKRKMMVTPTCAEPTKVDECRCICKGGYELGEVCAP